MKTLQDAMYVAEKNGHSMFSADPGNPTEPRLRHSCERCGRIFQKDQEGTFKGAALNVACAGPQKRGVSRS